jgi:hypothetical protein
MKKKWEVIEGERIRKRREIIINMSRSFLEEEKMLEKMGL